MALRDRLTLGWHQDIEAVTLLTLYEGDVCWGCAKSTWPTKTRR